jgi:hypothetical protein
MTRLGRVFAGCAVLVVGLLPEPGSAQTAWDSPLLLPPRPAEGFGIFLTDMYRGGVGVMATWQSPIWNYGLRAGISEGPAGSDLAVFGGVDYSGPLNTATSDFPIDIDWVLGAGLGISDGARLSFPLGLTAAHSFQGQGTRFTPYVTPRVVLDAFIGREDAPADSESIGLGFAVDVGLDLRILGTGGPLAGTTIRFGASLGRDAIGLGLVF